jgi:hypothetical protein
MHETVRVLCALFAFTMLQSSMISWQYWLGHRQIKQSGGGANNGFLD